MSYTLFMADVLGMVELNLHGDKLEYLELYVTCSNINSFQ